MSDQLYYPWYVAVKGDGLEQGDVLPGFEIIVPRVGACADARRLGNRLRLCPPYREHLAQSFARFFMRVGLPIDIPEEKVRAKPKT